MQPDQLLVALASSIGLCALGYGMYLLGEEGLIAYRSWLVRRDVRKWERTRDKEQHEWRRSFDGY